MADRFPSLEDFPEGQTEVHANETDKSHADDDFLARERALLGDDAAQFAGPGDRVGQTTKVEDAKDDLLGGIHDAGGATTGGDHAGGQDLTDFESSFPAIDTRNEQVAPGGTITGSALPQQSQAASSSSKAHEEEEPAPIREWRARRDADIARRAEISAKKKAETMKTAREWIDNFYENYNAKKDKKTAQSLKDAQEFLAKRQDTSSGGTSWERVAKLVDLSGKDAKGGAAGSGKEKFKDLLLDLKKDENAPGASGV